MNIAVIGLGYWGPNLVRNFLGNPNVTSVTICDKNTERLEAAARKFPGIKTETDVDKIYADPTITAVAIATPVYTHYNLARKALESGKHVIMEKPFTRTVQEAEDLITIAEHFGLTLMVDHTFLFTGAVQKMKEIIDEGKIGDVMYFDSVRANLGLFQPDVNVIWDLAPHDISILNYLVQARPIAVSATGMKHYYGMENIAYMTVFYDEHIIAHFHVNWLSPVKIRTICVGGSDKMIYYDDMQTSEKVRVYDKGVNLNSKEGEYDLRVQYRAGDMWAPQTSNKEALAEVAAHFIHCIKTGEKPICDGYAGRDVTAILEAAERSIKNSGQKVALPSSVSGLPAPERISSFIIEKV
ncbi:MAG: Gfo/Idh/MocA family oxidoreductase [Candidatus Kapabacteria bacterium]|nr:Gfo/Idh/MocA family oxidoreductase [Candidatus Kapabacteria bacterium]MBX7153486.1 Gfo/Idh/MocA family oxidoreductase [Bacteroidota bacterium]